MGKKKRKKKKGPAVGTLTTILRIRIPVPLTDEEEKQQLRETFQRSTVEKRTTNVPFFFGAYPSSLELQKKALEEAVGQKTAMEAAKARGEGTSSYGGASPSRGMIINIGIKITIVEPRPAQPLTQNQPRGYSEIVEKARRTKEELVAMARAEQAQVRGFQPPPMKATPISSVGDTRAWGDDDSLGTLKKEKQVQTTLTTPKAPPPPLATPRVYQG